MSTSIGLSTSTCPSCGSSELTGFYRIEDVPVHSVLLLPSREEALNYPTGTIALAFCHHCGFIANVAFDPSLHEYSPRYEETQGYSPTFNVFHEKLAGHLIERYDLRRKEILEIGCGKGEFLTLLCEMGDNRGLGFDPAYVSGRVQTEADVTFVRDFYSERYAHFRSDFICCKMTLEHISNTAEFMRMVRCSVVENPEAIVFFQVPNARYVFGDVAFWDIYYEHCSYFSLGSIARLFRLVGFDVMDLWTDYKDQYLMIEAKLSERPGIPPLSQEDTVQEIGQDVRHFSEQCPQALRKWREQIDALLFEKKRVVLWGGGSKGVSFLTTLKFEPDQIEYVVDINPHKADTYMAATGQRIVPPSFLESYQPDTVIIMNPVYREEIGRACQKLGIAPDLVTV